VNWRGLLVSVRDAAEAAAALEGGAAIIDVKEPRHGPLGAADPEAIAAVAQVVGSRRPWTMACGELGDDRGDAAGDSHRGQGTVHGRPLDASVSAIRSRLGRMLSLLQDPAVPPAAVKIGLAGAAGTDWRRRLRAVFESLPSGGDRVAVAYADWQRAMAPSPTDVIAAAAGLDCSVLLLDTFDKAGGGLFDCCPTGMPAAWVTAARAAGLQVVVAGRITPAEIPAAWALRPNVVALRSAVCFNGRDGVVQAGLVRRAVSLSHDEAGSRQPAG
jgi:(5-formylfuran-3-yl)methyl phosphate synthase